ncbi:hypothetical protein RFI_39756 [Reticulomyxa filosa]|uniref:Uncharacterized protein n=1 Tax=Reticulomyxa filosa TaxID=46433 RepID=X6L8E4_RETFI|nr:hypothetical protein RFI_39756 [Reticulomyxa filosa]|eukprot:ETN97770.1 hypothetical protein RFI_39756 [Reticulomyxa filosa]
MQSIQNKQEHQSNEKQKQKEEKKSEEINEKNFWKLKMKVRKDFFWKSQTSILKIFGKKGKTLAASIKAHTFSMTWRLYLCIFKPRQHNNNWRILKEEKTKNSIYNFGYVEEQKQKKRRNNKSRNQ